MPSSQYHDDSISLNGHQSKSPNHRPKVTIIGVSMLKLINPSTLRKNLKQNVRVKTFPGVRLNDMEYYVKPTIATAPGCIIFHTGTNDVKYESSRAIVKKICTIGKQITDTLLNTKLVISQLITNTDEPNLATKTSEVNKKIIVVCTNQNWATISRDNIKSDVLSPYGVYLTRQGTAILTRNYINCVLNTYTLKLLSQKNYLSPWRESNR